jgi:hypothetical protein
MTSRPIVRWALPCSTWDTSNVVEVTTDDDFEYLSAVDSSKYLELVVQVPRGIIATTAGGTPKVTVSKLRPHLQSLLDRPQAIDFKLAIDIVAFLCNGYSRGDKDVNREMLRQGVCTLLDCFNKVGASAPASEAYSKTIGCLQQLHPYYQKALSKVLGILVESNNWPAWNLAVAEQEEFDISAIVWVFKLDPLGLAAGIIQGKLVADILLVAEEEWILTNIDKDEYEEDKAALECFAGDLHLWGKGILAPVAGGDEGMVKA